MFLLLRQWAEKFSLIILLWGCGQVHAARVLVLFDEDIHWAASVREADLLVSRAKNAGVDIIVPCVWHGRGAYFPSQVAPVHLRVQAISKHRDPLGYLIEKAKKEGIDVHPWITVAKREADILPGLHSADDPEGAFSIHNPKFQDFMASFIKEIIDTYPINGIVLDYIRAMGVCKSDYCSESYKKLYKKEIALDAFSAKISDDSRARISQWNKKALDSFLKRISLVTKNKNIELAIAGHPLHERLEFQGQYSIEWANENYIDVIYMMDYKRNLDYEKIEQVIKQLADPKKLRILIAVYDKQGSEYFPRDNEWFSNNLKELIAVAPQLSGVALYHYPLMTTRHFEYFRSYRIE